MIGLFEVQHLILGSSHGAMLREGEWGYRNLLNLAVPVNYSKIKASLHIDAVTIAHT